MEEHGEDHILVKADVSILDEVDKVLNVNLRGAFVSAQAAIKHFLAVNKPGVIINISSVHQVIPKPRFLSYSISKGGMANLTRTLALEYAGRGIRVNAVGPGTTVTPINRNWIDDPVKREQVESHIPMGRAGTSEEMAAVVAFLCSDEAAYITTLIASRSFIARQPSGTCSRWATRSKTRPGSIRLSRTSGSSPSIYARAGAGPPAMVMLL